MTTLTDRYIWAVQRSLPEAQRDDIDRELRGTIADTIDGRLEAGADEKTAEREVLAELGDPYRLAAGYADRPLHLIGPKVFPDYIRLLKVLYAIVLPISFAAILLGQLLSRNDFWGSFGSTIAATITVAAHLGFWATLVFALIERSPDYKATTWSLDTLPQVPSKGAIKLSDTVAAAVWIAIVIGGLVWAQFFSVFREEAGHVVPVFDPSLGWGGFAFFTALALVELGFRLALYRAGRWTIALAAINTLRDLAFAVPFITLLMSARLLNPEFLERADIVGVFGPSDAGTITMLVIVLVAVSASITAGWNQAIKARR